MDLLRHEGRPRPTGSGLRRREKLCELHLEDLHTSTIPATGLLTLEKTSPANPNGHQYL